VELQARSASGDWTAPRRRKASIKVPRAVGSVGAQFTPMVTFWVQLDQPAIGDALSLLRAHLGLTRGQLIERMLAVDEEGNLGVDESLIYRWEKGEKGRPRPRPGARYRELLGQLCEHEVKTMDPIGRREFLHRLAALSGPMLLSGIVRIEPERLTLPGPVDPRLLDGLAALTRSYVRLHNTVSPAAVRQAITSHFDELAKLALRSQPPTTAAEIRSLAAQTAILAGWVSFNVQDLGQALSYWLVAHDLAREAGNVSVQAHALACRSRLYSPIHRGVQDGDPVAALSLLDQANELAAGAASPALRSWLFANRAQQLAVANRGADSYRDLDQAAHLVAQAQPTNDDVLAGWDEVRVDAYRGICAMVLRRPSEVIAITEPALARMDSTRVRRSLQQSDLAAAYAQLGDVDHASSLLGEALTAATKAQFPEGVQRALGVHKEYLARYDDARPVRELDQLIASLTP
jgi:tetratricopeptide (TPR) repeat protein